jgi:hypothetical protein
MKRILLIMALVWLVSGCAVDPRKEAEADKIRTLTQQEAYNQEQARAQREALAAVELQNAQLKASQKQAIAQAWRDGWNMTLRFAFYVFTAGVCYVLFMWFRSIAKSFAKITEGISKAIVRAAEVKANLIYLDEKTRQYPVFLQHLGKGRFSLVNPNANAVLMLDTRNEPDRQMIAAMGATQYAGALAREARQSNDPTGVSMVNAPVIDAKSELLSIGRDLVSHE